MKTVFFILLAIAVLCEGFIPYKLNIFRPRRKRSIICHLGLEDFLRDVVLSSIQDFQKKDPFQIGDSPSGRLENGVMRGLSSLRSLDDLVVFCETNNLLVLSSAIGLQDAAVSYRWYFDLLPLSGNIWASVKEVHVDYEVRLNSTKEYDFEVTRLKLTKLEGVDVGISGLWFLNPIIKATMGLLYRFREGRATEQIEAFMKKEIEKKLEELASGLDFDLFSIVEFFL